MTTRADTLRYFLAGQQNHVLVEGVEISHSAFSKVYRLVRNVTAGVDAKIETGVLTHFDYYPLEITAMADSADLDTGFNINFGDLGQVVPLELDHVRSQGKMLEKPVVIYRAWRSNDLNTLLIGPLRLQAVNFAFNDQGASFAAAAPYVNLNRTGEYYNTARFPGLKAFLK